MLINETLTSFHPLSAGFTHHHVRAGRGASYQRAATGDITQHGGARRLSGDQTEALKASLSNSTAKNVILLIGDGMGDSEITAARNQAMGPAVSFPVLMRCRSQASTPITRWTRKRISQTT